MTFGLLKKIITDNHIPKDAKLLADTENDSWTEDMDGIQYSAERKEICFTPGNHLFIPAHDSAAKHSKWIVLWCGDNCNFDLSYNSERICDLSDDLLRKQIRKKHSFQTMTILKEELCKRKIGEDEE